MGDKPDPLDDLLARLDRWLSKHRRGYFKGLRPGATSKELAALEKELGRELPDELRRWLSWHNSQRGSNGAYYEAFNLMSTGGSPRNTADRARRAGMPGCRSSTTTRGI